MWMLYTLQCSKFPLHRKMEILPPTFTLDELSLNNSTWQIFSVRLLLICINFAPAVKALPALVCNSWIILHLTSAFSTFSTSLFSLDFLSILFLSRNFDKKHKWIRRFVRETGRIHTRIFATLICFLMICFFVKWLSFPLFSSLTFQV